MSALALVDTGAEFSEPDRVYRYRLWRRWADGPMLMVIGLNPSTADERDNDPTIRRCIGYAKAWGFAGLEMLNIFSYRATDPKALREWCSGLSKDESFSETVHNLGAIANTSWEVTAQNGAILAAWGQWGHLSGRGRSVKNYLAYRAGWGQGSACLGLTKSGEPRHPLYLRADAAPIPFVGDGGRLCDGTGHHVEAER
jgi:hypothetical protein